MGWASRYIEKLRAGETVSFRPRGGSMSPRIKSGQLVTVEPLAADADVVVGDVVLCRVHRHEYLHLVHAVKDGGKQIVIANNHGFVNGTTSRGQVFGRLVKVQP